MAMVDDNYDIKQHLEESDENYVFLFPAANDTLRATCVTRSELQLYAKVFYQCLDDTIASAVTTQPFYQMLVAEFPIYVTAETFQTIMHSDTPFFLVLPTDDFLDFTASEEALEPDPDWTSADHCQQGSRKSLSQVVILDPADLGLSAPARKRSETKVDCQRTTNDGLMCLNLPKFHSQIGAKCIEFCLANVKRALMGFFAHVSGDSPMWVRLQEELVPVTARDFWRVMGRPPFRYDLDENLTLERLTHNMLASGNRFWKVMGELRTRPFDGQVAQELVLTHAHGDVSFPAHIRLTRKGDEFDTYRVDIHLVFPNAEDLARRYNLTEKWAPDVDLD